MPTRQSFVVDMVEVKEDLPNAIALNSMMVNGARLAGPAVAAFGEGVCFLLNAFSFVTIIIALLATKIKHMERKRLAKQKLLDSWIIEFYSWLTI
jgi:hypothetical protein